MKRQALFSPKDKSKKNKVSSAAIFVVKGIQRNHIIPTPNSKTDRV